MFSYVLNQVSSCLSCLYINMEGGDDVRDCILYYCKTMVIFLGELYILSKIHCTVLYFMEAVLYVCMFHKYMQLYTVEYVAWPPEANIILISVF